MTTNRAVIEARARAADRTARVRADIAAADRVVLAKRPGAITFGSVREALEWAYSARRRMTEPQGMHVSAERASTGQVDGGRGGDIDEVMSTMTSVLDAIQLTISHERMTPRQRSAAERAGLRVHAQMGRPPAISADSYPWMLQAKIAGIDGMRPAGTEEPVGAPWSDVALARKFKCDAQTVSKHLGIALERVGRVLQRGGICL